MNASRRHLSLRDLCSSPALLLRQVRRSGFILVSLLALAGSAVEAQFDPNNPIPAVIPHGPVRVDLRAVATELVSPVLLIAAPDGSKRIFIVEQTGQVWIVKNGGRLAVPFLDIASRMVVLRASYDERGLLGLAFDPGFADPLSAGYRRVFTYSSEPVVGVADLVDQYATALNHHGVVASWRVSPTDSDVIDPATRVEILRIDEPQSNHNGGTIAFGPDGYLYFGPGDGGGANDSNPNGHNPAIGNGQDTTIGLGKMLRIDVNGTNSANGRYGIPPTNPYVGGGGLPEIFAIGLRNPYRFSFDGNDLWVADVGQNKVEELDRVELGKNYGWRYKEGSFRFNLDGSVSDDLTGVPAGLTDPVLQYDHDEGASITGGYVYRGNALPELRGKYVFGDFSRTFTAPGGRLFYADLATGEIREFILGNNDAPLGLFIKGLGLDANGEIYVLGTTVLGPSGTSGVALKIVPPLLYASGGAVPGAGVTGSGVPLDATFSSLGLPSINDAGEVAFAATYTSSAGNRAVILGPETDDRTTFAVLVGVDDAAPDPTGVPLAGSEVFASFRDPVLNSAGRIAFIAKVKSKRGVPSGTNTGIWTNAAGELRLIAREGAVAPGSAGVFKAFTSLALGASTTTETALAFTALLVQTGAVSSANDLGLWLSNDGGAPALVLREGQMLQVGGVSRKVRSFKALALLKGAPGQGHGVEAGSVAARVKFHSGVQAVIRFFGPGDFDVVAVTGGAALESAFDTFSDVTQDAAAQAAFVATLMTGGGVTTANNGAIFVEHVDGTTRLIAREGMAAFGTDAIFSAFKTVVRRSDGDAAFVSRVAGGTAATSNDIGTWWSRGGTLALLAREGSPAPDTDGVFDSFKSLALPDGAGPLLVAKLVVAGAVTANNNAGLWAADSAGALHLILRKGSTVNVGGETKQLRAFAALSAVPRSLAQTRSYNANRQLIYRASLIDGSQAILSTTLP